MAAPKGNNFAKGGKRGPDKKARVVKERVLDVWDKLEKDEEGLRSLHSTAKANPEWFYTNFVKPMIPKEVDATIDGNITVQRILFGNTDTP